MNQNNQPLVTVITASYNSEKYIFETIKSVLEQTYPNIEFIITDDGSQNFPENEIRKYITANNNGNIKLKIISNKTNVGTVKNVNGALRISKGEYIFGVAADDAFDNPNVISEWVSEFINSNVSAMTSFAKMCGGSLSDVIEIMPSNENAELIRTLPADKMYIRHILTVFRGKKTPIDGGGAMAYSRKCIEEYNYYDESYRLMEDYPIIEKLLANGLKINLWEGISIRHRDGGVSHNLKPNKLLGKDLNTYRDFVIRRCFNEKLLSKNMLVKLIFINFEIHVTQIILSIYHSELIERTGITYNQYVPNLIHKLVNIYKKCIE